MMPTVFTIQLSRNDRGSSFDRLSPSAKPALSAPAEPKTFVYKTAGETPIEADVYLPEGEEARPVILWIHGGALMLGNRESVPPQLIELSKEENFTLVSIDYRLAPESKLPEIISDLRDAVAWVREKGPELFKADPDRLVVAGASAGGYLAQMSGISEGPLPVAIVSYWGYGDILGEWCTRPNPKFGGKQPPPTREEAFAGIGDAPITGTTREDYAARGKLFFYMKRFGLWTEIVSGIDPAESPEKLKALLPAPQSVGELSPDSSASRNGRSGRSGRPVHRHA